MTGGAGPAADAARAFQDAIKAEGYGTIGHGSGTGSGFGGQSEDVDVTVTYLVAPDDALPLTTPLVLAEPGTPAGTLVAALDAVGGVIAVDVGGTLQTLRLAAPWTDPGWGGAPVPDDELAWDILLGPGALVIDADDQATMRKAPVVAGRPDGGFVQAGFERFRARLAAGAEPVVDVLVSDGTTAQELVDALTALHAAGARRIGVGIATWRLPTFTPDGQAEPGSR
jgi:hypothetical protein